jgi:TPR repeat protein
MFKLIASVVVFLISLQFVNAQTLVAKGNPISPFTATGCVPNGLLEQAKQMQSVVGNRSVPSVGGHFANIGYAYLLGCGFIQQDFDEARYWLEFAARSKDVTAALNIAWMYQNGLGYAKDERKARTLYDLILASSEVPPGNKKVARLNSSLISSLPDSGDQTRVAPSVGAPFSPFPDQWECPTSGLLFIAKQLRSMNGTLNIASAGLTYSKVGYAFLTGCGALPKDLDQAKVWLEIAWRNKEPAAGHNLAWMNQNGILFEKDQAKSRTLYLQVQAEAQERKDLLEVIASNLKLLNEQNSNQVIAISPSSIPLQNQSTTVNSQISPPISSVITSQNGTSSINTNAGRKRALVIGNNNYRSVQPLANAAEDAKSMAENLQSVGYQVTLRLDLNEKEMKAALRNFSVQVEGGDEVLFFFAGHGVQLGSSNYLLPIDITGENEAQVRDEAIQLQRILDDMSERKAKLTLAMIDACRDNPFKTTGRAIGGRGLAPTTAATGQMVIFSAGTGQQALDRLGPMDKSKNGLFTRIFIKEMQKPGLSVDRVLRNVRNEVVELAKSVGHEQVPAIYDQVVGDFYFRK